MENKNILGFLFFVIGGVIYYYEYYNFIYYILYGCLAEFMVNSLFYSNGLNPTDYAILYVLCTSIDGFDSFGSLEKGRIIFYSNVSDAVQQLVGKKWGKTRIVRYISPNKTAEGYLGGFLAMSLVSYFTNIDLMYFFSGIVGDLMCSYSKRKMGIKDWSKILGSHGGILDRFNSSILGIWLTSK